jgi:hypothetical protein
MRYRAQEMRVALSSAWEEAADSRFMDLNNRDSFPEEENLPRGL